MAEQEYPQQVVALAGKANQAFTRAIAKPRDARRAQQEFRGLVFQLHGHGLTLRTIAGIVGIPIVEVGRKLMIEDAATEVLSGTGHPSEGRAEETPGAN